MGRSFPAAFRRFIEDCGVPFRHGSASYVGGCPDPNCAKSGHFYVRKTDGKGICFKCGGTWDWRGVVAALTRRPRADAWRILFGGGSDGETGELDPGLFARGAAKEDKPPVPAKLGLDFIPVENSGEGLAYLMSRGITPDKIVDFDVRWNGGMRAVVFPVSRGGVTYGWQARLVAPGKDCPKILSGPRGVFSKSRFLLNADFAMTVKKLVLVEGPVDCVKADRREQGFGAGATLGKGVSLEQIAMVINSPAESVYIGVDDDAYKEMYGLVSALAARKTVYRPVPPKGKDFGACCPGEALEALENARQVGGKTDLLEVYFRSS